MEPLIKCEHVDLGYENQDAVINVNMEVCPGDYLCIVGENGSGQKYPDQGTFGAVKAIRRQTDRKRRIKNNRNWLSAPADSSSERFPCFCKRSRFKRLLKQKRQTPFLF